MGTKEGKLHLGMVHGAEVGRVMQKSPASKKAAKEYGCGLYVAHNRAFIFSPVQVEEAKETCQCLGAKLVH